MSNPVKDTYEMFYVIAFITLISVGDLWITSSKWKL